jgi:hypothetical protein
VTNAVQVSREVPGHDPQCLLAIEHFLQLQDVLKWYLEILCPFAVLRFDWYKEHDMHRLSEQQAEQKTVKQFHSNA